MSRNLWRVEVDRHTCIGSGLCVGSAPDDFHLGLGRQSQPRLEVVEASDAILEAAENCPVEAILLADAADGAVLFPPE
ncbi:ferredoxin [Yinghuangia sp. YIM S09857]|uniref:ferredoxin n=1 Tax=Yinghuangia sp. YIM S09857 TaxID=3436929 RepID=UPI003F533BA9